MIGDEDLIKLVDQRIRLAQTKTRATGTVVSRDTTGSKAMVLFDGATTATPAKVTGTTFVAPGDRCLLDRYGSSDWVVTNSWAALTFGEANRAVDSLSGTTGPQTSAAYTDLSEFGTFSFTKFFDLTFLRISVSAAAYQSTTATAKVGWAVRLTQTAGATPYTPADLSMGAMQLLTQNMHQNYTSYRRLTGVPAGTYTVTLRWRRAGGTGTILADANDSAAVEIDERVRAVTPIL